MSKVNNTTCLESKRYRGFYIDKNVSDFGTIYYSIVKACSDTDRPLHVHINKHRAAKDIVDCYYSGNKRKYGRLIRNRALSLELNKKIMF